MPLITRDYTPFPIVDKKNGTLEVIYQPIFPIRLSINHKLVPFSIRGYVDSGAQYNLFPASFAEEVGIKVKKGVPFEHLGIGNIGIKAYRHEVKIFVDGYNFLTTADFSSDQIIPILGLKAFFTFFKNVTFNQEKRQLELRY